MNSLLRQDLVNLKLDYTKQKEEIKRVILWVWRLPNNNITDVMKNYNEEKEVLKKYNCFDTSEILDYLTRLERSLMDLDFIIK